MKALLKGTTVGTALALMATAAIAAGTDWPVSGHDAGGQRYSPLTQINKSNVAKLQIAWTYHMTPAGYTGRPRLVESVPVNLSNARMGRVLSDAAAWHGKVERMVETLAPRFPDLSRDVLKSRVLSAGERHGAQLGAPRYRRALLAELVALDLTSKNAKNPLLSSRLRATQRKERRRRA